MRLVENDRWAGEVLLPDNTRYVYTIEAFPDRWATWRDEVEKKFEAGQDVALELLEGRAILAEALPRTAPDDRELLEAAIAAIDRKGSQAATVRLLLAPEVEAAMRRARSRRGGTLYARELEVVVDRPAARFAAWYEMFPRSAGTDPTRSATFAEAGGTAARHRRHGIRRRLPDSHPPDRPRLPQGQEQHPGRQDRMTPACPTASAATRADTTPSSRVWARWTTFAPLSPAPKRSAWRSRSTSRSRPRQITPGPESTRSGSPSAPTARIRYAENPPKKYQDIYPLNFDSTGWRELWLELRRVILFWVEQGVKTFRVDNPHTKPTVFWEWLIADVQRQHPEVIFLSEAFTRPKVMKSLAKAGFTQSYTYFTWRNFKAELEEYFTELTQSEMKEYYRGNLFPNTHDILPFILQEGGRPAFKMRFALAATLSSRLRHLLRLRAVREHAGPGPGGVPQLREVRVQGLGLGPAGEHHPLHHPHQRHPPRASRSAPLRQSALLPQRRREHHRLRQGHTRWL